MGSICLTIFGCVLFRQDLRRFLHYATGNLQVLLRDTVFVEKFATFQAQINSQARQLKSSWFLNIMYFKFPRDIEVGPQWQEVVLPTSSLLFCNCSVWATADRCSSQNLSLFDISSFSSWEYLGALSSFDDKNMGKKTGLWSWLYYERHWALKLTLELQP